MKKQLLLILFVHLLYGVCFSQDNNMKLPTIIPPSSDAAALARYAEILVSYSTGVPDISISI